VSTTNIRACIFSEFLVEEETTNSGASFLGIENRTANEISMDIDEMQLSFLMVLVSLSPILRAYHIFTASLGKFLAATSISNPISNA
jgi:hypothetical protein